MHSNPQDDAAETQRRLRHAIRTPLNSISLSVMLLRQAAPGPDESEALDAIARAVQQITAILSASANETSSPTA
jgi:signal transduction histidine kinase